MLKKPINSSVIICFLSLRRVKCVFKGKPPSETESWIILFAIITFSVREQYIGQAHKTRCHFPKAKQTQWSKKKRYPGALACQELMDKVKFVRNLQIKYIRFSEVAFALFSKLIMHKMGNGNVC